ncbi:hypothetical protein AMTRI_Chr10g232160 [Amborella trichopoda]
MANPCKSRVFAPLFGSFPSRNFFSHYFSTISIKKVTRNNFTSSFEELRHHVREADFVALDLEMSGITSAPWRESFEFDHSTIRYLKIKDSAEKFAVVQFGVCPFRYDNSTKTLIAYPHSFYIFPRKELPIDFPSCEFLCQTTSIEFLARHQFDFNACIHEGISYLSRAQEAEALHQLGLADVDHLPYSECNPKETREMPLVSFGDILFTERMKIKLSEWRDSLLRNQNCDYHFEENSSNCKLQFRTDFFKMRPSLLLSGFSSHQLRLIQQVIRKHFDDLAFIRINDENSLSQNRIVYTDWKDDRAKLMEEVRKDMQKVTKSKVDAAVGFRHVIDLLSSEGKVIVGHNCLLDIAHVHSKFLGPLPSTLAEFASSIHKLLPYIIDTKRLLISELAIQRLMKKTGTSLSSAFSFLCSQMVSSSDTSSSNSRPFFKVEVLTDEESSSNQSNPGAKHEAGYDAFMTGCVFAQICHLLGIDFSIYKGSDVVEHEKLQKHLNLLYLGWNSGTMVDMKTGQEIAHSTVTNLKKRFPKIQFSNIVLVWGFQKKFKPWEMKDIVTKVLGISSVTSVFYLDETAAFVQFSKEQYVQDFLVLKDTVERESGPLSVLHPLGKLLEGGNTRAAKYDIYKEICSSPLSRVLFADQTEAMGIKWKTKVEIQKLEQADVGEGGSDRKNEVVAEKKILRDGKPHMEGSEDCLSSESILDVLYSSGSLIFKKVRT